MRTSSTGMILAAGLAAMLLGGPAASWQSSVMSIQLLPDELKWNSNPKLHGLQTATLAGNPNGHEYYAERILLPAGFRLEPHSHPNSARMVTVLSGTLYYGVGERFDEAKLKALPAGSFFTEPEGQPHYALAKEQVVLQLNAIGPAATTYVNAANDPAKKK